MAKATKKVSATPKKADLSEFGTKDPKKYKVGTEVIINAHIAGCQPRTLCEITEVRHDTAQFRVKVLRGPGAGEKEFLVWANQLN